MLKKFFKTTKRFHFQVQELTSGQFLAQLTTNLGKAVDPYGLHYETLVLENTDTVEQALDAINFPHDILGIPLELQ